MEPRALVNALLNTRGIRFYPNTKITQITKAPENRATKDTALNINDGLDGWQLVFAKQSEHQINEINHSRYVSHTSQAVQTQETQHAQEALSSNDISTRRWDQVIVANAAGASELLQPLLGPLYVEERASLEETYGQLTWGEIQQEACKDFLPYPLNGEGSFLMKALDPNNPSPSLSPKSSHDPKSTMMRWFAGSTFERFVTQASPDLFIPPQTSTNAVKARNALNLHKLERLYPRAFDAIKSNFQTLGFDTDNLNEWPLNFWAQWRCNTRNRLPWVQDFSALSPNPPNSPNSPTTSQNLDPDGRTDLAGLSVLTGLGSKGIALAPLCAEILACSIHQEPSPVEGHLRRNFIKINP